MDARRLVSVVVLLVGAHAPLRADAATPEAALRAALAERLGMPEADIAVTDLELPDDMPADADFVVELPGYTLREGRVSATLATTNGSWRVSPDVKLWVTVPVAVADTVRGEPVELRMERVRLRDLRGSEAVDPSRAWEATTGLRAGQPVTVGRVRRTPDLHQGAAVKLVVEVGALSVRAPGQLLSDAVVGQSVPVLNLATKAQQFGTLRPDGTVLLGGP